MTHFRANFMMYKKPSYSYNHDIKNAKFHHALWGDDVLGIKDMNMKDYMYLGKMLNFWRDMEQRRKWFLFISS